MSAQDIIDDRPSVPPFAQPPMTLAVEAASAWAATQMHLFANAFSAARNLQGAGSIPLPQPEGAADASPASTAEDNVTKEGQSVVDIERDARVGIDLKIGTLTFQEGPEGEFAAALVDVIVAGPEANRGTRVQMEIKIPTQAETQSIMAVTEACRQQIVGTLRAAADKLDAMSARELVFHKAR